MCITVKWTWYNGRDIFFHITSGRINTWKGVNQLKELFCLNLIFFFLNIHLKLTNHRYFMIKNPLFFTIHNKNGVLSNFKLKWPYPGNPRVRSVDREPCCLQWQRANARANLAVMMTRAFSRRNQHRAKALYWKSVGRKKVLVMLGYHSIQQMLSIWHDKSDFGRNSPLTERRTLSANHLFTLQTAVHADHRVAIPILHVKYRAQFLLGVGWGGMSHWVYVTLSCHNWKHDDFCSSGAYSIY